MAEEKKVEQQPIQVNPHLLVRQYAQQNAELSERLAISETRRQQAEMERAALSGRVKELESQVSKKGSTRRRPATKKS